jgi:hypothetical protein
MPITVQYSSLPTSEKNLMGIQYVPEQVLCYTYRHYCADVYMAGFIFPGKSVVN